MLESRYSTLNIEHPNVALVHTLTSPASVMIHRRRWAHLLIWQLLIINHRLPVVSNKLPIAT
jgi:hypothetical protein